MKSIKETLSNLDATQLASLSSSLNAKERKLLCKSDLDQDIETIKDNSLYSKIEDAQNREFNIKNRYDSIKPLNIKQDKLRKYTRVVQKFFNVYSKDSVKSKIIKSIDFNRHKEQENKYISESKLIKLLRNNSHGSMSKLLIENGFSPTLVSINISKVVDDTIPHVFKHDFSDLNLIDCTFDGEPGHQDFVRHCIFENTSFDHCTFRQSTFGKYTKLNNCDFKQCSFSESYFITEKSDNIHFEGCSFSNSHIDLSLLENSSLNDCKIDSTHLKGENLTTDINECKIDNTIIDSTITLNESNSISNKNTKCASLVHFTSRGGAAALAQDKIADQKNSSVIPIEQYSHSIDRKKLSKEILKLRNCLVNKEYLDKNLPFENLDNVPTPQLMIAMIKDSPNEYPECYKLMTEASEIASQVDSIFIPGNNADIPLLFYDSEYEIEHEDVNFSNNYKLPLMEIFLIDQAFQKGIPLMGVCHGFQMINVFFGSQMEKDVEGQIDQKQVYSNIDQNRDSKDPFHFNEMVGFAYHHQAVIPKLDSDEQYLEENLIYDGMVKASSNSIGGSGPIIATQFHPEFYIAKKDIGLSKQNQLFWDSFHQAAEAHKNKKEMLKEIREMDV